MLQHYLRDTVLFASTCPDTDTPPTATTTPTGPPKTPWRSRRPCENSPRARASRRAVRVACAAAAEGSGPGRRVALAPFAQGHADQVHHGVLHRHFHMLALAGRMALLQRSQDADRHVHAGAGIADRRPDVGGRPVRLARRRHGQGIREKHRHPHRVPLRRQAERIAREGPRRAIRQPLCRRSGGKRPALRPYARGCAYRRGAGQRRCHQDHTQHWQDRQPVRYGAGWHGGHTGRGWFQRELTSDQLLFILQAIHRVAPLCK